MKIRCDSGREAENVLRYVPNWTILFCMQNVLLLSEVLWRAAAIPGKEWKLKWKQKKSQLKQNHNADLVKCEYKDWGMAVVRAAAQRNWASADEIFSDQSLRNTPMEVQNTPLYSRAAVKKSAKMWGKSLKKYIFFFKYYEVMAQFKPLGINWNTFFFFFYLFYKRSEKRGKRGKPMIRKDSSGGYAERESNMRGVELQAKCPKG